MLLLMLMMLMMLMLLMLMMMYSEARRCLVDQVFANHFAGNDICTRNG
jgi:hypothetical protein